MELGYGMLGDLQAVNVVSNRHDVDSEKGNRNENGVNVALICTSYDYILLAL